MEEEFKNLGIKRLFLTRHQKFIVDLSRLGQDYKPDKVEAVILFLEELHPSLLSRTIAKKMELFIRTLYWRVMPKRLRIIKTREPFIYEYLPWFPDKYMRRELYFFKHNKGRVLKSNACSPDEFYTYSWKKAYHRLLEVKHIVDQEEKQHRLNRALNKQAKGEPDET